MSRLHSLPFLSVAELHFLSNHASTYFIELKSWRGGRKIIINNSAETVSAVNDALVAMTIRFIYEYP
jgi:hypothetical protein